MVIPSGHSVFCVTCRPSLFSHTPQDGAPNPGKYFVLWNPPLVAPPKPPPLPRTKPLKKRSAATTPHSETEQDPKGGAGDDAVVRKEGAEAVDRSLLPPPLPSPAALEEASGQQATTAVTAMEKTSGQQATTTVTALEKTSGQQATTAVTAMEETSGQQATTAVTAMEETSGQQATTAVTVSHQQQNPPSSLDLPTSSPTPPTPTRSPAYDTITHAPQHLAFSPSKKAARTAARRLLREANAVRFRGTRLGGQQVRASARSSMSGGMLWSSVFARTCTCNELV